MERNIDHLGFVTQLVKLDLMAEFLGELLDIWWNGRIGLINIACFDLTGR
jgi:hypothetical protein